MVFTSDFSIALAVSLVFLSFPLFTLLRKLPHASLSAESGRPYISSPLAHGPVTPSPSPCDPEEPFTPLATRKHFRLAHIGNRISSSLGICGGGFGSSEEDEASEGNREVVWRLRFGKRERGEERAWTGKSCLKGGREKYRLFLEQSAPPSPRSPTPEPSEPEEVVLGMSEDEDDDGLYSDYDFSLPPASASPLHHHPANDPSKTVRLSEPLADKTSLVELRQTFRYGPPTDFYSKSRSTRTAQTQQDVDDSSEDDEEDEQKWYKRTPPLSRCDRRKWMQQQAAIAVLATMKAPVSTRVLRSATVAETKVKSPVTLPSRASSLSPDRLSLKKPATPLVVSTSQKDCGKGEKSDEEESSGEEKWADAADEDVEEKVEPAVHYPPTNMDRDDSPPPSACVSPPPRYSVHPQMSDFKEDRLFDPAHPLPPLFSPTDLALPFPQLGERQSIAGCMRATAGETKPHVPMRKSSGLNLRSYVRQEEKGGREIMEVEIVEVTLSDSPRRPITRSISASIASPEVLTPKPPLPRRAVSGGTGGGFKVGRSRAGSRASAMAHPAGVPRKLGAGHLVGVGRV